MNLEARTMNLQMQIGELARRVGVDAKTIRYYEEIGLLPEPPRTEAGYRLYSDQDASRLAFIRRARALDFSLGEVNEILNCRASGEAPCPYVLRLIHAKIATVEQQITELERLKRELRVLEREAGRTGIRRLPQAGEVCHILETTRRRNSRRLGAKV
jgi:MerR family transcriptional regulator, copper efflux regulator